LEGKASAREFSVLHHFSVTHNHDSKRLGRSSCFLLSDTKPLASHNIVNVSPDRQKISGAIATASRLPALIDQYNRGRRAMWVLRSVQIVQSFFCMSWCIYSVSFCLPHQFSNLKLSPAQSSVLNPFLSLPPHCNIFSFFLGCDSFLPFLFPGSTAHGPAAPDPTIHGVVIQMPLPKHLNEAKVWQGHDPLARWFRRNTRNTRHTEIQKHRKYQNYGNSGNSGNSRNGRDTRSQGYLQDLLNNSSK